jgi:hypothetical protein
MDDVMLTSNAVRRLSSRRRRRMGALATAIDVATEVVERRICPHYENQRTKKRISNSATAALWRVWKTMACQGDVSARSSAGYALTTAIGLVRSYLTVFLLKSVFGPSACRQGAFLQKSDAREERGQCVG